MAQLKSTSVTGNLSVTGNVVASQIIKLDGTSDHILMSDGGIQNLNNFNHSIIFKQNNDLTNQYNINNVNLLTATNISIISSNLHDSAYDRIYVGKNNNCSLQYRTKREFLKDLNLTLVYNFKGTVNNINALKNISSANIGDVYSILDTGDNWACHQAVSSATNDNYQNYWSNLGKNVDLSGYMTLDTEQTITGVKTFTNNLLLTENSSSIITRSGNDDWTAGIYSNRDGDEVLGILVKNKRTHIMLGIGDAKARPTASTLTPAIDIKNNKVGINKRLGTDNSADAGSYNLDVNGSLNTVSMTLDTSATFTYNTADKCIDVLFT